MSKKKTNIHLVALTRARPQKDSISQLIKIQKKFAMQLYYENHNAILEKKTIILHGFVGNVMAY